MNLLFETYLDGRAPELTVQLLDDYTTLCMVSSSLASHMSEEKEEELVVFGAMVGLALVHGQYPANLNPLLLMYLLCDCDIMSLNRSLVLEWFPALGKTLEDWISISANNPVIAFTSHFASYHNFQVCVFDYI